MPYKTPWPKWREENPELYQKRLARSRKWHEENRELYRRIAKESSARKRAECREEYNAYMRAYNQSPEQKERLVAQNAAYYRTHKVQIDEKNRRWAANNAEKERIRGKNKAAWRRGAAGRYSAGDIQALYQRQNGKCAICGLAFTEARENRFQIDHVIPLKPRGAAKPAGTNNPENLQLLCRPCNRRKSNHMPRN
jgi:5-methylcytosine-specific restriction endonuclease McrA